MTHKNISTFDREMQDPDFKEAFEIGYKKFLLSELLTDMMEENHKSVRSLASEVGLSPTIIQRIRSGHQKDLKLSNLVSIAAACGYHLFLEKDNHRIELQ